MRRKFPLLTVMALIIVLILAPTPGIAQDQATCTTFVKTALEKVGQNCANLNRNQACYGYNRVDATFASDVTETVFTQPADRVTLGQLMNLQTAPLNSVDNQWGIALLNVQANVPDSLPGQAVTFILIGDANVEDAVKPEDAYQPVTPITVKTKGGVNLRSGPGTNTNSVGKTRAGDELQADGVNADATWLHVFYNGQSAWVRKDLLTVDADLSSLPVLTAESRTPMQAFYFRAGVGKVTCKDAPPSVLVVQGPDKVKVNITANGADIQIGSTIALQLTDQNAMQLVTLSGTARAGNLNIPKGFTSTIALSADGRSTNGNWSRPRALTADELAVYKPLENIPATLLHYPIVVPAPVQIQSAAPGTSSAAPQVSAAPGGGTPPPPGP